MSRIKHRSPTYKICTQALWVLSLAPQDRVLRSIYVGGYRHQNLFDPTTGESFKRSGVRENAGGFIEESWLEFKRTKGKFCLVEQLCPVLSLQLTHQPKSLSPQPPSHLLPGHLHWPGPYRTPPSSNCWQGQERVYGSLAAGHLSSTSETSSPWGWGWGAGSSCMTQPFGSSSYPLYIHTRGMGWLFNKSEPVSFFKIEISQVISLPCGPLPLERMEK